MRRFTLWAVLPFIFVVGCSQSTQPPKEHTTKEVAVAQEQPPEKDVGERIDAGKTGASTAMTQAPSAETKLHTQAPNNSGEIAKEKKDEPEPAQQAKVKTTKSLSVAETAIQEAVKVLEKHRALAGDPMDILRIDFAIVALSDRVEPADKSLNDIIPDFVDNTEKYRGKTITLELTIWTEIAEERGRSLQNFVGSRVDFHGLGPKGAKLSMTITLPNEISVPRAVTLDRVLVTFICSQGRLNSGNEAVSVKRP